MIFSFALLSKGKARQRAARRTGQGCEPAGRSTAGSRRRLGLDPSEHGATIA
jgi:hypothetical protein